MWNCAWIHSSIQISSCYLQARAQMMVALVVTSTSKTANCQQSNILCRPTVATSRLYVYNQNLLLPGQILLVFLWSRVILIEPFNTIRYACSCFHH